MNDEPGAGVAVREDAPPETATPAEKRRLWPLLAGGVIAAVIAVTGAVHGLGGRGALIAAGGLAVAVLAGLVLWRLPHLRRHFARPRGAGRMFRSSRTARRVIGGGKGAGFLSGGKRGKLPGGGVAGKGKGLLAGKGRSGLLAGKGRPGAAKSLLGKGRAGGKALAGKGRGAGKSLTGTAHGIGKRLTGGAAGKGRVLKGLAGRVRGRVTGGGKRAGKLFPSLPGGKGRAARKAAGGTGRRRAAPAAAGARGTGGIWKRARFIAR